MRFAITEFINEIKFSVIGENTNLDRSFSIEDFSVFNIVNELSVAFLYLQTTKSIKNNNKNFKFEVSGLNNDNDFIKIIASKTLSNKNVPSQVFVFFAIAIQETLFNPMTSTFLIHLLEDEICFYKNNNLYLPHTLFWMQVNPLKERIFPVDTFQEEQIIKSINNAQNTIQRFEKNKDKLELKLCELLSKNNSIDILLLIFGNYNQISNIHSCTRLYVLAKTIISIENKK